MYHSYHFAYIDDYCYDFFLSLTFVDANFNRTMIFRDIILFKICIVNTLIYQKLYPISHISHYCLNLRKLRYFIIVTSLPDTQTCRYSQLLASSFAASVYNKNLKFVYVVIKKNK